MISIPGKIPVRIFPLFWLLILLIGWLNGSSSVYFGLSPLLGAVIWAVVIFFSVLLHEYGHAGAALLFGQRAEIELVGLGGITKRAGKKTSPWQEFLIVLNGPMVGITIFLLALYISPYVSETKAAWHYLLRVIVEVNLFWTLLNLLPILPLDGGQLLKILLERFFGMRGIKIVLWISILLASFLGLYFFVTGQIFMGAIFLMLAFESFRGWEEIKDIVPEDASQKLQQLLKTAVKELEEGYLEDALEKFSNIRQEALRGVLYVTATEYGARILAEKGLYKQAYLWLYPLKNKISFEYLRLLQQVTYRIQEWEESIEIGELAYLIHPSQDIAILNASACAMMGKVKPALGWLRSAHQSGLKEEELKEIAAKREFDSIREHPLFQHGLATLTKR